MKILLFLIAILIGFMSNAQSEPSTYFNIYVPPNNTSIQRNVSLIITAINDSTYFEILDDDADGDNDDSVTGWLLAGQSYILYMKDNGINDDALYASGGTLKRDGDYFIINSSNLVYASMSTDSDWQHDFVPAVNKKSVGQKFFVYSPKISSSLRDLNVFAYEPNTKVTISKISTVPTTQTGYTNIDVDNKEIVIDKIINPGEDLIHFYPEGRNCMETGGTYLIESNKDVSVQYGALWHNSRDGGAYVPSGNGSSSGEIFYFAVPFQSTGEQEIRVVSLDTLNSVSLARYENGTWVNMANWNLDIFNAGEWVGRENGNVSYSTVFKVSCSPGKRVSVFEANWMETGYTTTSDMATMVSSSNGTSSGTAFLTYMLPPGQENNVVDPFTGNFFSGSISHFYLYAGNENTTVTIKDAKTNGQTLTRTYQIDAGKYADAFFTVAEWQSIYNGTGTTSGSERPYVKIESTKNISVLATNFNDNWMTYLGSSLPQSFSQNGGMSQNTGIPGDTVTMTSALELVNGTIITDPELEVKVGSGLEVKSSTLTNTKTNNIVNGNISKDSTETIITFTLTDTIDVTDNYALETSLVLGSSYNNSNPIPDGTVLSVETKFSGVVDGEFQQSILSKGVENNAENTSNLLFSECQTSTFDLSNFDSWNGAWIDYDQDGWEDVFVAGRNGSTGNELYRNNSGNGFTKILNASIVDAIGQTSASVWADINNDGRPDVLLVNETQKRSELYLNAGNGQFNLVSNSGLAIHPEYFHGAAFADFDNDGYVDLIITNFFQTKFHQLYRNLGDNSFEEISGTPVTSESHRATAPILGDYNNDGWVDIFIGNGNNESNSLFKNIGGFQFEKVTTGAIVLDSSNSVGAAWGDYDNDGHQDLFVVNSSGQNNFLYKNNGDGSFTKILNIAPVNDGGHSHSASWVDVNNDSYLDLYITNDVGAKHLYLNDGNGEFNDAILEVVTGDFGPANGVAWADYNRDGQMDMMSFTHGSEKNHFFCNNGTDNNWISFELKGEASNTMALGAKMRILSGGTWQMSEVLPVSGFGSQNSKKIHFGLGSNTTIDSAIVYWPSGIKQVVEGPLINDFNLIIEDDTRKVSGVVFLDENANGIFDPSETKLMNVPLKVVASGYNFVSNTDGFYEINVADSTVLFEVLNSNNWLLTNPGTHSFGLNQEELSINLALQPLMYEPDLEVNFGTTAWRRGFKNTTVVQARNLGTMDAYNVEVNMNYPLQVSVVNTSSVFTSTVSDSYTFLLDTLKAGETFVLQIEDSVKLEALVGEVYWLSATISTSSNENNLNNNSYAEQLEVVGAIDPNDISVSPKGDGEEGFVNKEQWLTYTVRFENVGTWSATYVNIESQLSEDLDISSFEFVQSSHEASYSIDSENILRVRYDHIGLPAVSVDSLGAQGYFKFKIKSKETSKGGEIHIGSADIVFDFESPVITNTVVNTVKYINSNDSESLHVFPNPVLDKLTFEILNDYRAYSNLKDLTKYEICDVYGKIIVKGTCRDQKAVDMNVQHLPGGQYHILAWNENGEILIGKFIKQ